MGSVQTVCEDILELHAETTAGAGSFPPADEQVDPNA